MTISYYNSFSWSMKRREMLQRCPAEYFYHYYGAAGGAFANTFTRRSEKLHLLRSLLDTEMYVKTLVYTGLRTLFNSGASAPGAFSAALLEKFSGEFRDMLLGKPEQDHKRPLLQELVSTKLSPADLAEKVTARLKEEAGNIEENLLPELLNVPSASRCQLPFPLKISWNNLECYVTPLAAWQNGGTFNVLCSGTENEENSALLHFFALEKFQTPPEKVKIFHLVSGRLSAAEKNFSASGAFRRIRQDSDRMLFLELQLKSGVPDDRIFPRQHEMCGSCRFRSFCFSN